MCQLLKSEVFTKTLECVKMSHPNAYTPKCHILIKPSAGHCRISRFPGGCKHAFRPSVAVEFPRALTSGTGFAECTARTSGPNPGRETDPAAQAGCERRHPLLSQPHYRVRRPLATCLTPSLVGTEPTVSEGRVRGTGSLKRLPEHGEFAGYLPWRGRSQRFRRVV